MNVPNQTSAATKPNQPTWLANLGIGLAAGIIIGMLIASWGLRQDNWQKAGPPTVAVVLFVIVSVLTALVSFGTAFVRNGFRCRRRALLVTISIFAAVLGGLLLFLEPTRVQRVSAAKLKAAGANIRYESKHDCGLKKLLGEEYFEGISDVEWNCETILNPDLTVLKGLDALETLELTGIKCPPSNLESLRSHPRLKHLYLRRINFSDNTLLPLGNNPILTDLYLENCQLKDKSFIENNNNLAELYLLDCQINDKTLESIGNMRGLTNLDFLNNTLNDSGLQHISKLTQLKELSFVGTSFNGDGLANLNRLVNLEILILNLSNIADPELKHLVGLTNLKKIILIDTQVTDEGVDALKQFLPNCAIIKNNTP